MKLHALTLSWNGEDKLKNLSKGLFDNFSKLDMECHWHIRDNGSKDNTKSAVKDFKNTHLYEVNHNRDNFAQCVNFLFKESGASHGDIILLLNNDVEFASDNSLASMYNLIKGGSSAVGARLLYSGTNKLQHAGVIFSKQYGFMPWHYRRGEESNKAAEKNRYFQAVTAAVCMIDASSFIRVEGMDEVFRWAFEDVDLMLKIGQNGKIAYCGKTKIYHEESASLNKNPVNKMFLEHNVAYFKKKWFGKYDIDHDKYLNDSKYKEI